MNCPLFFKLRLPCIIELFWKNSSKSVVWAYVSLWLCAGFSLRILVAGERCNITGEYFERGFKSEQKFTVSSLCSLTILTMWTQVVPLVFREKVLKGLVSSPLFGCSVTIFHFILPNLRLLDGKMIIYINCSDKQFSRGLKLLKIFQLENFDSFHPKTIVSHLNFCTICLKERQRKVHL